MAWIVRIQAVSMFLYVLLVKTAPFSITLKPVVAKTAGELIIYDKYLIIRLTRLVETGSVSTTLRSQLIKTAGVSMIREV